MFLKVLKELVRQQNQMFTGTPDTAENQLFPEKTSAILAKTGAEST